MNRISALILLLAFAAFFIEAVKLPTNCEKQSESKCTMTMKIHSTCKMMAEMVKKHSPQQKGKDNPTKCSVCPLFTAVTFKGAISYSFQKITQQTEYSVMLNNNLSDYYSQQWKPPNKYFI